jgi:hypothetical protein
MKLSILSSAAAAAILSTCINAQQGGGGPCKPCPGGITVDLNTETIPGRTCGTLQQDAAQYSATSQTCNTITADAEDKCCPITTAPAFSACSVCSGGLTVPGNTEIPNTGGITCDKMMNDAETTSEGSNVCTQMKESEGTCCPQAPVTTAAPESTTCSVCSGGIPPENMNKPTIGSKTCKDLLGDAPKFEEGSNACNAMKTSEDVCCPFVPTTTAATTTVEATTTTAAEIITPSPTVPTPTVSPTKKPTIGPTTRDQLFGNVLQTPTNEPDANSPTPAPTPQAKTPTNEPTKEYVPPTYTPTIDDFNGLSGQGRPPPGANEPGSQFNLPGDKAGAPSTGVSADFRIGFLVILVSGVCGILFA